MGRVKPDTNHQRHIGIGRGHRTPCGLAENIGAGIVRLAGIITNADDSVYGSESRYPDMADE